MPEQASTEPLGAAAREEEVVAYKAKELKKLVYLAVPYSHEDAQVREARFQVANTVSHALIRQGLLVFSPISHTHPIAVHGRLELGFEAWEEFDLRMLTACDELWIVLSDGWAESEGIATESRIAVGQGKPIRFVDERGVLQHPMNVL